MYITREHYKNKSEAIEIIDRYLDSLLEKSFPGGVKVTDPYKTWNSDTLWFSFTVEKGLMPGIYISGTIKVTDRFVFLSADVPGIVTGFLPESKIREKIDENFERVFKKPSS
jgi:hypothetical protein